MAMSRSAYDRGRMAESVLRRDRTAQIQVDTRRWPLAVVTFVGTYSEDQFDLYLSEMDKVVARAGRRVLIYDATECGMVAASQRRKQADWMKKHAPSIRGNTAGIVFVLPSALLRGALTAIFWIHPLESPHAIVKDMAEAEARAREWLAI